MSDDTEENIPSTMKSKQTDSTSAVEKPPTHPQTIFHPSFVQPEESQILLTNPQLSFSQLNNIKIYCNICNLITDSATFFQHAVSTHSLYCCLCCLQSFNFSKMLLNHLQKIHKTRSQDFASVEEFLREFGTDSLITCQDCGLTFDSNEDIGTITNHVCNSSGVCPNCKKKFILSLLGDHVQECIAAKDGKKRPSVSSFCIRAVTNQPSTGNQPLSITSSLRMRPNHCKTCGQFVLQKDMAAHKKDCREKFESSMSGSGNSNWMSRLPQPLTPKTRVFDVHKTISIKSNVRPKKMIELTTTPNSTKQLRVLLPKLKPGTKPKLNPMRVSTSTSKASHSLNDCDVTVTRISFSKAGAPAVVKPCDRISVAEINPFDNDIESDIDIDSSSYEEEELSEEEVQLDPLLLEESPEKRLKLLIKELDAQIERSYVNVDRGFNKLELQTLELIIDFKLSSASDEKIISTMLNVSQHDCVYCRQATLIKVDKRQLVIHLLSNHKWKMSFVPIKHVYPNINLYGYPDDLVKSVKDLVLHCVDTVCETIEKTSSIKTTPEESAKNQGKDEDILETSYASKLSTDLCLKSDEPCPEVVANRISLTINSSRNHPPSPSVQSSDSVSFESPEPVEWGVFRLSLLEQVFLSDSNLFSFRTHEELRHRFGEFPCECLLCSFPVDAQRNLFYHWRKTHRGISMSCAMCGGRFLFVGALFSHLCLGTTNPVVAMEPVGSFSLSGERGGERTPVTLNGSIAASSTAPSSPVSVVSADNLPALPSSRDGELGSVDKTIVLRYQCALCDGLELPGFFNYMVHLRKDHTRCELCLETVNDQRQLEYHMKKHKLNHFCWKCGVTYCTKPNFMTHLFWKHGTESEECSKCLKKKWPHIYHYCLPNPWFKCDVCHTYFSKAKFLIVHRRLHSKEKMRKCPKPNCTEEFISRKLLEKHLENGHNKLAITENGDEENTNTEASVPVQDSSNNVHMVTASDGELKLKITADQMKYDIAAHEVKHEITEQDAPEISEPSSNIPGSSSDVIDVANSTSSQASESKSLREPKLEKNSPWDESEAIDQDSMKKPDLVSKNTQESDSLASVSLPGKSVNSNLETLPKEKVPSESRESTQESSVAKILEAKCEPDEDESLSENQESSPEKLFNVSHEWSSEKSFDVSQESSPEKSFNVSQESSLEKSFDVSQESSQEKTLNVSQEMSSEKSFDVSQETSPEKPLDASQESSLEKLVKTTQERSPEKLMNTTKEPSPEKQLDANQKLSADKSMDENLESLKKSVEEENKSAFDIAEIQGPNLSEDESSNISMNSSENEEEQMDKSSKMEVDIEDITRPSSRGEDLDSSLEVVEPEAEPEPESVQVNGARLFDDDSEDETSIHESNESESSESEDSSDESLSPSGKSTTHGNGRPQTKNTLDEEDKVVVSSLLDHCETLEKNLNLAAMDMDEEELNATVDEGENGEGSAEMGDEKMGTSVIPPLSLIRDNDITDSDKKNGQDDFGPMSPLLPPLEDFNFNVPEIPTFEDNSMPDHIIRENALFSLHNEHDYARKLQPLGPVAGTSGVKPKQVPRGSLKVKTPSPKINLLKKFKACKPSTNNKRRKKMKGPGGKRRRSHSSGGRSSSVSSCHTNCSCSSSCGSRSSSSSGSSSSSDSSDSEKAVVVVPKKRRGRPPLHNRPIKPRITDPTLKRGRGRPKGSTNKIKSASSPIARGGKRGPKPGFRRVSKAPENPLHGIPINTAEESDLETEDSGSEEAFHKRQLTEVQGAHASNTDQIWTMSNEKYLLKYLRGIKDIEELRPPPEEMKKKRIIRRKKEKKAKVNINGTPEAPSSSETSSFAQYSVKQSSGPPIRLKVKNVPLKPLTLIRRENSYECETICHDNTTSIPESMDDSFGMLQEDVSNLSVVPTNEYAKDEVRFVKPVPVKTNAVGNGPTSLHAGKSYEPAFKKAKTKVGIGRGKKKQFSTDNHSNENTAEGMMDVEGPSEKVYCYCQSPHDNVSQMIGCDGKDCEFQWFHFECVDITIPPKGKWFCPDCREKGKNSKRALKEKKDQEKGTPHLAFIGHMSL